MADYLFQMAFGCCVDVAEKKKKWCAFPLLFHQYIYISTYYVKGDVNDALRWTSLLDNRMPVLNSKKMGAFFIHIAHFNVEIEDIHDKPP